MSGGRIEVGLGAGWHEDEHRRHGFPFPRDRGAGRPASRSSSRSCTACGSSPTAGRSTAAITGIEDSRFHPRPGELPGRAGGRPNIIVGGDGSPRSIADRRPLRRRVQPLVRQPGHGRGAIRGPRRGHPGRRPRAGGDHALRDGGRADRPRRRAEVRAARGGPAARVRRARRRRRRGSTPASALGSWHARSRARAGAPRFAAAGVERIMLQDFLPRDLAMIDLAAEALFGSTRPERYAGTTSRTTPSQSPFPAHFAAHRPEAAMADEGPTTDPAVLLEEEARLALPSLGEADAIAIGRLVLSRADAGELPVTIEVRRGARVVFRAARAGTSPDNDVWIAAKAAVVERFGHSTWYVRCRYLAQGTTFEAATGLEAAGLRGPRWWVPPCRRRHGARGRPARLRPAADRGSRAHHRMPGGVPGRGPGVARRTVAATAPGGVDRASGASVPGVPGQSPDRSVAGSGFGRVGNLGSPEVHRVVPADRVRVRPPGTRDLQRDQLQGSCRA